MPLLTFPWPQILSAGGSTYPGAKLFFYETGTSTLATTYSDAALTTPHTNPVIADATGVFPPIYLANKRYKAVLKTAGDVTLFSADPAHEPATPSVATIAAMTAIDAPTNGMTVQVSDLDRGGYFVFDTTSTSAADNGVTFKADDATSGSWVRQYSGPVNVKWFGAVGDGAANDTGAIQDAADYCNTTNTALYFPTGNYAIYATINFQNSSVFGESAAFTKIRAKSPFVGDYALQWYRANTITGIFVRDLVVDCEGNAGGFAMYRLYDSCVLSNLAAYNAKADRSAFRIHGFDTSDGSPVEIGQTLYAENLIGNHADGTATVPTFSLNRMQEATFQNIKFWAGNGSTKAATEAALIDDCRSVTFIGPSFATSSSYACRVSCTNRTTRNIVFINPLYENVDNLLHVQGTAALNAFHIMQVKPRYESPVAGGYLVEHSNSAEIETRAFPITVGATATATKIHADLVSDVTDNGSHTTIIAPRNAVNASAEIYGGLRVSKDSGPAVELSIPARSNRWSFLWNASGSADFGYNLRYFDGTNNRTVYLINAAGTQHQIRDASSDTTLLQVNAPASGATALYVVHNDGTTSTLKQVFVGAADSGGSGFRQLRIAN